MSELLILLAQFLGALFAVLLAGMILAKLHLLPAVLYAMFVQNVFPVWVETEHGKYLLILAAFLLYAVLRLTLCCIAAAALFLHPLSCTLALAASGVILSMKCSLLALLSCRF